MIIIYLRKSRADSPLESVQEVLERHERQLQEYALKTFGEVIPEENIYREIVSGETIENRPEMRKVLQLIESPLIKGVLVIEPQRLSRGDLIDCGTIVQTFKYSNTKVYTPRKVYDLKDRYDEKFFTDELMRGSEFLEYTKEILNRGKLASVNEGNYIASVPPYGYDRTYIQTGHKKSPTLKVNEDEAQVVKMIFDMYGNQNMSPYAIAKTLNDMGIKPRKANHFTPATVDEFISNIVYVGKVKWNSRKTEKNFVNGKIEKTRRRNQDAIIVDGKHEAIIDEELFNRVQERKGKNPRAKKDRQLRNPFANLVKCQCGRGMTMKVYKNKDGVERAKPRLECNQYRVCGTRSVLLESFEEAVIESLREVLSDFELSIKNGTNDSHKSTQSQLDMVMKELSKLEERQETLFELLESKTYTEQMFIKRNKALAEEREKLESTYKQLKTQIPQEAPLNNEEIVVKLSQALDMLKGESVSAKIKNDYLSAIIEKIVYTPNPEYNASKKRADAWSGEVFEIDIFLKS